MEIGAFRNRLACYYITNYLCNSVGYQGPMSFNFMECLMKLNKKQSLVAIATLAGIAAQPVLAEDYASAATWPPLAAGTAAAVTLGAACGYGQTVGVKTDTKIDQSAAKSVDKSAANRSGGGSELSADAIPQTPWTETVELVPVTAIAQAQPTAASADASAQPAAAPLIVKKAVAARSEKPRARLAGKSPVKPAQANAYAYGGTGNCLTDMLTVGGKVYSEVFQIPPSSNKAAAMPAITQTQPTYQAVAWHGTR